MLKFFLVAHLTYENQWVSLRNKIRTFGFLGHPSVHPAALLDVVCPVHSRWKTEQEDEAQELVGDWQGNWYDTFTLVTS